MLEAASNDELRLNRMWTNVAHPALSEKPLTFYHTVPPFNDPNEEGFGKHCGKRRKCWWPAFSPFPTMFSTLSKREILILATFIL